MMKQKTKTYVKAMFACVALAAALAGGGFAGKISANADEPVSEPIAGANEAQLSVSEAVGNLRVEYAAVKYKLSEEDETAGIKFLIRMNKATFESVKSAENLTIGVLIIPEYVAQANGAVEIERSTATVNEAVLYDASAGINAFSASSEDENSVEAEAYLYKQTAKHYDKTILVRGYASLGENTEYCAKTTRTVLSEVALQARDYFEKDDPKYAELTKYLNDYTVEYDTDGVKESETKKYGDSYTEKVAPKKANAVFLGWKYAVSVKDGVPQYGNDYYNFAGKKVKGNMYFKAAFKEYESISATFTQGETQYYTKLSSLDDLKGNLEVKANVKGGVAETVTDYTLSGELTAGENEISVTWGDGLTAVFTVEVTDFYSLFGEGVVADFDNTIVPIGGSGAYSTESQPKLGTSGHSFRISVSGANTDAFANVLSGKDLTGVTALYYSVYFDSSSFKGGTVPSSVPLGVVPRPGGDKWDVSLIEGNSIAFDRWVQIKATLKSGKPGLTEKINFWAPNYKSNWDDSGNWGASGYSYQIFIDEVAIPSQVHSDNEIAFFDDVDATAVRPSGSGIVSFSRDITWNGSKKSLKITATGLYNYAKITPVRDLSGINEIYYWVYFESASFNKDLPTNINWHYALPRVNGWNIGGAQSATGFDKWILVKATRTSGAAGNALTFNTTTETAGWLNDGNWGDSGYRFNVYIDTVSTTAVHARSPRSAVNEKAVSPNSEPQEEKSAARICNAESFDFEKRRMKTDE